MAESGLRREREVSEKTKEERNEKSTDSTSMDFDSHFAFVLCFTT